MPRKELSGPPDQQTERFRKAVQEIVNAGELTPIEADAHFERAMGGIASLLQLWFQAEVDQGNRPLGRGRLTSKTRRYLESSSDKLA